ncbi:MAG: DegT/DnrJ/EryC1/StrS family aminotransferase [Polyangiales bacterium]
MTVEKEPTDERNFIRDRRFCARARDAFKHLLAHRWPGGSARIVLPAYIGHSPLEGSGIMDPLTELGIPYSFYRVDERLDADLSSLESELRQGEVFASLIIHYFGSQQPEMSRARALCHGAGAMLIEDCCHCLDLSGRGIGEVGDYALFSIHKVLPCADGGILQCNQGALDPGAPPADSCASSLPIRLWCDAAFDEIAARRVRNYELLAAEIDEVQGVRLFWPSLPKGAAPLNLPVLIDEVDRFGVYKRMRARGVGVVALYHTLVDAIEAEAFPTSHEISRKILNLPIHQDVESEDVGIIAGALKRAIAES